MRRSRIKNERRRSRGVEDIRLLKGGNFPFEFIIKAGERDRNFQGVAPTHPK